MVTEFVSDGSLFDRRDVIISLTLLPFIAFNILWLLFAIPSNAPFFFPVVGWLLLAHFAYILAGRLILKRRVLQHGLVSVGYGNKFCVTKGVRHPTMVCRLYGPAVPIHVDYIRNGVANVFVGAPSYQHRLWAGSALWVGPGQSDVYAGLAVTSVEQLLAAMEVSDRQVTTSRWLGARREPSVPKS